jgi:uncharacterized protein YjbI with pentapeptide repeats
MKEAREIKNRWTGKIIAAGEYNSLAELAMASKGNLTDANLRDANLTGADLTGADLTDANLTGADLTDANLTDANLTGADLTGAGLRDANLTGADLTGAGLRVIRDDIWAVLCSAPAEADGLRLALVEGRIEGSVYKGECACLVGTLANLRHCGEYAITGLSPNPNRPAERFFLAIRKGDTPETNRASKMALQWVDEFLANMRAAFCPAEGK